LLAINSLCLLHPSFHGQMILPNSTHSVSDIGSAQHTGQLRGLLHLLQILKGDLNPSVDTCMSHSGVIRTMQATCAHTFVSQRDIRHDGGFANPLLVD